MAQTASFHHQRQGAVSFLVISRLVLSLSLVAETCHRMQTGACQLLQLHAFQMNLKEKRAFLGFVESKGI